MNNQEVSKPSSTPSSKRPLEQNVDGPSMKRSRVNNHLNSVSLSAQASSSRSPEVMEKQTFLLFVKILFKLLEEKQGNEFANKARRVVMECRRRNQQKDPKFCPLMEALERRLRLFVGEPTWKRAHAYLHHYLSKQHGRQLETDEMRPQAPALAAAGN